MRAMQRTCDLARVLADILILLAIVGLVWHGVKDLLRICFGFLGRVLWVAEGQCRNEEWVRCNLQTAEKEESV